MSVIDVKVLEKRLNINANGKILKVFQNACYKAMDRFVPMDNGDLRTKVDLSNLSKIVYESPYAHAQYIGYTKGPVRHYTTAGTGPYWDLRMWSAKQDEVIRAVKKSLKL